MEVQAQPVFMTWDFNTAGLEGDAPPVWGGEQIQPWNAAGIGTAGQGLEPGTTPATKSSGLKNSCATAATSSASTASI